MTPGGPKGRIRTELISSSPFNPSQHWGQGGGRKGQNPIGLSFCPPVLQGPTFPGKLGLSRDDREDLPSSGSVLSRSTPPTPSGSDGATEGGRNKPHKGAASVLRFSERPPSSFLSLDEAALFDGRAAIREYDGGLPRAAAERLAWLDVISARAAQPLAQAG